MKGVQELSWLPERVSMNGSFELVGEVDTDSRKRLALAGLRLRLEPNSRYRIEEGPYGELRLVPVFTVTSEELAILQNPEARQRLQAGVDSETFPYDAATEFAKTLEDCDDETRLEVERLRSISRSQRS